MIDLASKGRAVPDGTSVQAPPSTTTRVALVQARERFSLQQNALTQGDRILESRARLV